jgi:hypothetical protein
MRKIEREMIAAVVNRRDWHKDNTAVYYVSAQESGNPLGARAEIKLHNNLIAEMWYDAGALLVNVEMLRRYPTPTTKSRLRALQVNVTTKRGVTYLDNEAI